MRPVTVTVGPLAAASATNIATSQTIPTGGGTVALNGSTVTNTFVSSGASTITGNVLTVATVVSGVLNPGDLINGLGVLGGTRIIGPVAGTVNLAGKYVLSVNNTAGGFTVRANSVATLDTPRRVIITSGGNDSGVTFTFIGTDWSGTPITEQVVGANIGVASTVLDYLTITQISASTATASTITVGTNGVAASAWVRFDDYALTTVSAQFSVTGAVNYSYQTAMDEGAAGPYQRALTIWDTSGTTVVGATSTTTIAGAPVRFGRVLLNSSTGTGNVLATFIQYGSANF